MYSRVFWVFYSSVLSVSGDVFIKKFRSGNEIVFREVFNRFYLPLKAYAFRIIDDETIVEDFVQDSFLHIWEARERFYSIPAIKSFLYTTVRNSCLIYLRHQKVKERNESEIARWILLEDEEKNILEDEVNTMLYEAIKDLSEKSRDIVIMTLNGSSNIDIAKELNISVNTVKTVKLRAYRVLRKRLKGIQWLLLFLLEF